LSYLECPAHLKFSLFPEHPNLTSVGELPPLDMPHSMKADEWCQYRDGVTLPTPSKKPKKKASTPEPQPTLIECGLPYPVTIDYPIPPGVRVTLKFADSAPPRNWPHLSQNDVANLKAEPVEANAPREEAGYYWGFVTRKAESLSAVYTECPLPGGYDFSIGTSERGVPLSDILPGSKAPSKEAAMKLPSEFNHLLLVIGGVTGLETAVESDPVLKERGLTKETASDAFDAWVNLVPGQGSRTIRTEEAVWVALMGLHPYVSSRS
jgi:predicted SPOUT superfamily RNA methylase MTH1